MTGTLSVLHATLATIAACGKLDAIRRRWSDWILSDPERRERLAAIFRERFAGHAPRRYDGSGLTFPGLLGPHRTREDALRLLAFAYDRSDALRAAMKSDSVVKMAGL